MLNINNTTRQRLAGKKIQTLAAKFLRAYKRSGEEVSLAVVGAARMKSLNRDYRGIDKPTDVLSFPAQKMAAVRRHSTGRKSERYLGEIIINIEEAEKPKKYQAMFKEIGLAGDRRASDPRYIFNFLLVHGLLHLIGYDDKTESERLIMLQRGRDFLGKVL